MTLAAGVAAVTYWNSLTYGFAQDAFTLLARVRGLVPRPPGLWRTLAYDIYFGGMDSVFPLDPFPFRVVTLGLHAVNAALVAWIAARLGLSPAAAALAGCFFAAHNAHFEAVFAVAGVGELMATTGILLATALAAGSRGHAPRAVATILAFAAALACKETVLLFPLLLGVRWVRERDVSRTALLGAGLIATLFLAQFVAFDPFGSLRGAQAAVNPYRPETGLWALWTTWCAYAAWAVRWLALGPAEISDGVGPAGPGAWATLAGILLLAATVWKARGAGDVGRRSISALGLGLAMFILFLAPVLPLAHHAYRYYLYLPLAGLGLLLAAVGDVWLVRRARPLVWALAVALAVQGIGTVRGMEALPLGETGQPFLGSIRRARIAHRVLDQLPAGPALPADLVLFGPDALAPAAGPDTSALAAFRFNDVAGALDEGNGIRLHFPEVRTVRFLGSPGEGITATDVLVFDYDGAIRRGPSAALVLLRARREWEAARPAVALGALDLADTLARRWQATTTDTVWRRQGNDGIRALTLELGQLVPGPAGPLEREWLRALEHIRGHGAAPRTSGRAL